jgi:uncharacterized lipoprotein
VNSANFIKVILSFSGLLLISGCQFLGRNYRDTTVFEQPPLLEGTPLLQTTASDDKENAVTTQSANSGLGDTVILTDAQHIRLKQPLNLAWNSVEKMLKLKKIEIVDRNLELGAYYINYAIVNEAEQNDNLLMTFFKEQPPKTPFLLILKAVKDATELRVRRVSDALGPANAPIPADAAERLLKTLYHSLHDDFPVD